MKIAEIRDVIRNAEWARGWYTGGTAEEFRRQEVGPRLAEKIAALRALEIPARFAADAVEREKEIARCESVIARWHEARVAGPQPSERNCNAGGTRHVLLGGHACVLCGKPHAAH